jgi:hypothetical protein
MSSQKSEVESTKSVLLSSDFRTRANLQAVINGFCHRFGFGVNVEFFIAVGNVALSDSPFYRTIVRDHYKQWDIPVVSD